MAGKKILLVLAPLSLAFGAATRHASAAKASWLPALPKVQREPLPDDPMGVVIRRLPNGLTLYMSPDHQAPRVSAWIVTRTGSKDESVGNRGSAHYLEHMLFKGSRNLGTLDYAAEKPLLDRIGRLYEERAKTPDPARRAAIDKEIDAANLEDAKYAVPNEIDSIYGRLGFTGLDAFTSYESTVFVCSFPSNRAQSWAEVESDRFAHPVFRLFPTELEAVYEEKNRSMDNQDAVLDDALRKALFPDHPYGHTVLGPIAALKNPSLIKMREFFRAHYVPNNMAIVLAGDFDPDAMAALIQKYFGSWKPEPPPRRRSWPLPKPKGEEDVSVYYNAPEEVVVAWPTVSDLNPDADALTVMDMLANNSVSGLVDLDLVQAQKVEDAGSYPDFENDAGYWALWAVPNSGQSLEQARALLLAEADKLKAGDFTQDDIRAVVTSFEESREYGLESDDARAQFMADSFIDLDSWPHSAAWLDRLSRVSKDDVVRAANEYLGPDRVAVFRRKGEPNIPSITKPGWSAVPIAPGRESAFAKAILSLPAKPAQPRWLVAGRDYIRKNLPQGTLYAVKNPYDDLFSLSFYFDVGRRQEKDLCASLRLMDLSGGGSLGADAFKKKLFALGTSLNYSCGEQDSEISLSGLNRNLWPSLQLLRARFAAPNIASGTLQGMIAVIEGERRDDKRDEGAILGALQEYATRGKNSAVLGELSDKELRGLSQKRLVALAQGLFSFKRRVAYVGNREPGEIAQLLLENQRYENPPRRRLIPFVASRAPEVIFVPRRMVQAKVGVFAQDEIYSTATVVDGVFYSQYVGGDMDSVLFQQIREARSLAYSVWGGYDFADYKGEFNSLSGGLGCEADKTAQASALLGQLMRSPDFFQARFERTRAALEENYRGNPILFRDVPGALMDWEDLGFDSDPRPARFAALQEYSPAKFKSFVARFKDKALVYYVLGDPARVDLGALGKLGDLRRMTVDGLFPY